MSRKQTKVEEFDAKRVRPLPGQPRKRFRGIQELANSIAEVGQLKAGIVTLVADDPRFDAELVDGERRLRACQLIGHPFRAEVREAAEAEELFAASFAANFSRQDHDVLEIAESLQRLTTAGKSVEQIKRMTGKSDCWIYQHLSLLKLHPMVQQMLLPNDNGETKLTFSLALLLVPLDEQRQIKLANRIGRAPDKMSMAGARRMILKVRHKAGDATAYSGFGRHPRMSQGGLESLIEQTGDRIGIYFDAPGSELNKLIDSIGHSDKRKMIELIEDLRDNLQGLAEAIDARLPKAQARMNA